MKKAEKNFIATSEFIHAVAEYSKTNSIPNWKIAVVVDVHPSVLSRAVNEKILWEPELLKIKAIAHHINFQGECFKVLEGQQAA